MIPQQTLFEWLFNVKCDKCLGGESGTRAQKSSSLFLLLVLCILIKRKEHGGVTHSHGRSGMYIYTLTPPHRESRRSNMHVENETVKGALIGLVSVLFS